MTITSYSSFSFSERAIVGGFCYFLEDGNVVGGTAIGSTSRPLSSLSAWDSFYMGCTQNIGTQKTEKVTTVLCPNATGGYTEEEIKKVNGRFINFQTSNTIEPTLRYALGADTNLVDGVVFTPFSAENEESKGWLKVKLVLDSGQDVTMMVWGKLMLANQPTWSNDIYLPEYKFQILDNSLNWGLPNF